MATNPKQESRPFIIEFAGTRFAFPELRFAIKRAAAITLGTIAEKPAYKRVVITYAPDPESIEETRLGVVISGEWFPVTKPVTFEALERAMVQRGFAFHLLNRVHDRLQAEGRKAGMAIGWASAEFSALDAAGDIIKEANERVADEMTHTERTAHYNIERLTER